MEEHLRAVATNKDCHTDEAFAFQVRLQLLAQETVRAREHLEANQGQGVAVPPVSLFLGTLQKQLQYLRMVVPSLQPSHGKIYPTPRFFLFFFSSTTLGVRRPQERPPYE